MTTARLLAATSDQPCQLAEACTILLPGVGSSQPGALWGKKDATML